VVFDGKMWVLGGDRIFEGPSIAYNDVWCSSDGVNWTESDNNADWSARGGHASVVHDGKMWVLGGGDKNDVWYTPSLANPGLDLNNDGAADFLDVLMLLREWKLKIEE
jgi:hypothetical protein